MERGSWVGQFLSVPLAGGSGFKRQLLGICVGGEHGVDPLCVHEPRKLRGADDVEGADPDADAYRDADGNTD